MANTDAEYFVLVLSSVLEVQRSYNNRSKCDIPPLYRSTCAYTPLYKNYRFSFVPYSYRKQTSHAHFSVAHWRFHTVRCFYSNQLEDSNFLLSFLYASSMHWYIFGSDSRALFCFQFGNTQVMGSSTIFSLMAKLNVSMSSKSVRSWHITKSMIELVEIITYRSAKTHTHKKRNKNKESNNDIGWLHFSFKYSKLISNRFWFSRAIEFMLSSTYFFGNKNELNYWMLRLMHFSFISWFNHILTWKVSWKRWLLICFYWNMPVYLFIWYWYPKVSLAQQKDTFFPWNIDSGLTHCDWTSWDSKWSL